MSGRQLSAQTSPIGPVACILYLFVYTAAKNRFLTPVRPIVKQTNSKQSSRLCNQTDRRATARQPSEFFAEANKTTKPGRDPFFQIKKGTRRQTFISTII